MVHAAPARSSSPSLRIAVLGVGGVGSTFAFQLARVGRHEVTLIARPESVRLAQLKRGNGIVNTKRERADVLVTDRLDEAIPYDLVLITLLAHQVEALLPTLQRSAAKWIQFMFNNFNPEGLRDAVGAERCSFGMPFVQASITRDGNLNAKIGLQKSRISHPHWVQVFHAAGLPAVFEPEMLLWLRCHVPLCVAFESVSVAGVQRGKGATWDKSLVLARGLQESLTLIERLGYRLYPSATARLQASPAWVAASMLWLVSRIPSFRELLATGANECRALIEVLVANAPRATPPVRVDRIQAMRPSDDARG